MSITGNQDYKVIFRDHRNDLHVEEGAGTYGKREAPGVKRLYVEVKDEDGHVVYQTWQDGPVGKWERVTLYFDRYALDGEGNQIGFSLWG